AKTFADADLFCTFGHTDQHDVHDHDGADDERDRSHADGHELNRAEDSFAQVVDGARRNEAEVVILFGFQFAPRADDDSRLVNRVLIGRLAVRLDEELDLAAISLNVYKPTHRD